MQHYLKTRSIDGRVYGVSAINAREGLKLGVKLLEVFAPFLGTLAEIGKKDIRDPVFGKAIEGLFSRLSGDEAVDIMDRLFQTVEVVNDRGEGRPIKASWTQDFAAKLGTAIRVAAFATEAQFGDFLSEWVAKATAQKSAAAPELPTSSD